MKKSLLRSQEGRRITLLGFWVNAALVAIKIFAGIVGRSGAMLADGVHSLSDFLTDIVVLAGFKLAEQPEDEDHNYGHGKYETLATTVIGLFLGLVGYEILKTGVGSILLVMRGEVLPKPGTVALMAAMISILAKELLFRQTASVGKRINSPSIIANGWHHRSDAFSSIGTFLGIGGAIALGERWTILDPIASVIVSLFIFKVAYETLAPALRELTESSLTGAELASIHHLLKDFPQIRDYHQLRTRRLGNKAVIDVHLLVDNDLGIDAAHRIATEIEGEFLKLFGEGTLTTTHVEPYAVGF